MTDYRRLFDLAGRKALVLGAGSGIGRASAEAISALGAEVHCADIDEKAADATAQAIRSAGGKADASRADAANGEDIAGLVRRVQRALGRVDIDEKAADATAQAIRSAGGKADASRADAANGEDIAGLVRRVQKALGRVDIAVTTPGVNIRKTVLNYTDADFDRIFDLNVKGTFYFFREVGRIMTAQKGGSIIATSSVRATTIEPGLAVYGATKAAISLLVKGFAAEMGVHGVRVNAIAPSIIETGLTGPIKARPDIYDTYARHTVISRWGQPSEVGSAVAFLASDAASYISGSTLMVDAGWTAIDGPPTGLTQIG